MIKEMIAKVVQGRDLAEPEMASVMEEIMDGRTTPAQIGAFITALRLKGETVEEITGAARVMRQKATRIDPGLGDQPVLVDTCGTGGDASGTFNVSTAAAFVVAAAGVPVAKHGNRSVSSHCGSADVLEALGVDLSLSPAQVGRAIREVGIGFLFAPALHGAMKHAIGPRREIGIRTIFNILGPLTNPAGANVQLMGVYDGSLVEKLARVLGKLGAVRALVVSSQDGLDEITVTGPTTVAEFAEGRVTTWTITPEEVGLERAGLSEISGGRDAAESARLLKGVLAGEPGARRNMVLLNAGAALMAAGRARDLAQGVALAAEAIDSGEALKKLEQLVTFSSQAAGS